MSRPTRVGQAVRVTGWAVRDAPAPSARLITIGEATLDPRSAALASHGLASRRTWRDPDYQYGKPTRYGWHVQDQDTGALYTVPTRALERISEKEAA